MLRNLKNDESWEPEEMLKEQLHFKTYSGIQPIVHNQMNTPYYAYELCEIYHEEKCNKCIYNNTELSENKVKSANKEFIPMNGRRKKIFNQNDIIKIKEMSKNGISNRKIAKEFHCSEKTIRNYLKDTK